MKSACLVVAWTLLLISCAGNEPFILLPLGVTEFTNVTSNTTSLYTYKKGKIQSFSKSNTSGTSSMKFHYHDEVLTSIVRDSSADGYFLTRFHNVESEDKIDSTFHITPTATTLMEVRKFSYNEDNRPDRIEIATWSGTAMMQNAYELVWAEGNASEIKTLSVADGVETIEHVVAITYDDKKGTFSSDVPYEYTFPADELYWLSANNPVRFKRDTLDEVKYTYFYNIKNYPSHIVTDKRQVLACTYAELR